MLPCYGPDHEDRRQAAASGLIVLRQLHRIVGRIEVIGHEGQPINIPVTDGTRQNRVFLNLLGAQWAYVMQALMGDLSILTSRIGPGELWERLAIVAADHPFLVKEIVEEAETNPGLRRSSQFLTTTTIGTAGTRQPKPPRVSWQGNLEGIPPLRADFNLSESRTESD
jgi:hypothetical protein